MNVFTRKKQYDTGRNKSVVLICQDADHVWAADTLHIKDNMTAPRSFSLLPIRKYTKLNFNEWYEPKGTNE